MDALSALFVIGCALTLVAVATTILLSPKPCGMWCHLRGAGRLLVFAGAAFGLVRVCSTDWKPVWQMVLFVVGIGLLSALHMRDQWTAAEEKERRADLSDEQLGTRLSTQEHP